MRTAEEIRAEIDRLKTEHLGTEHLEEGPLSQWDYTKEITEEIMRARVEALRSELSEVEAMERRGPNISNIVI